MKFWAKFSKTIFKIIAYPWLRKIAPKSIEAVLKRSIDILEPSMVCEIKSYILEHQTPQGGFADRAGKSDLYYSLFGYFISESFSVSEVQTPLKKYVKQSVTESILTGVHLYCGAILYAKLCGSDSYTKKLKKQIITSLKAANLQKEYSGFLGIMALYYLGDFVSIRKIMKQYQTLKVQNDKPCSVVAATAVLLELAGRTTRKSGVLLNSYYRSSGGFAAIRQAPSEDLLSTAVALYALNFINADMRLIKPDCMSFIDDLYLKGGFRSMHSDPETDVEYTFYGLLALGSMNN